MCTTRLVLIAQAVFLLELSHTDRRTQTQKVTDATEYLTLTSATAGLGN